MDHIVLVKVVDGAENLFDGLRCVLFCEFSLLADAIEELAARRQLSDDVVLVLTSWSNERPILMGPGARPTHSRLEPVHEFNNVGMMEALKHF